MIDLFAQAATEPPVIHVGWEALTAAATALAGGLVAAAKLLIGYQERKDVATEKRIDAAIATNTAVDARVEKLVDEIRIESRSNLHEMKELVEQNTTAFGDLKTAIAALTFRVDHIERPGRGGSGS